MTLPTDGLITVNGQDFAIGLEWRTEPTDGKLVQAARRTAREVESDGDIGIRGDFYVLRPQQSVPGQQMPQYGIGFRAIGHRAKVPAGAAVLAEAISALPDPPESWVGVFRTPEGRFWFVNVNDEGAILTEAVFEKEDAARQHLEEAMTLAYDVVYAPAAWGLGTPLSLNAHLQGDQPRLIAVSSSRPLIIGAIAAATLGIAAFAGLSVWQDMEEQRVAAELEAQRRAAEQAGLQGPEVPRMIPPWYKEPDAAGLMTTCAHALRGAMIPLPGWDVTTGTCGSANITIQWARDGGVVWWAAQAAQQAWPGGTIKVGDQGNEASLTISLPKSAPRGEEAVWPGGQAVRAMWSIGQSLNTDVAISQATPEAPPPLPGTNAAPPPKLPWNAFSFEMATSRAPNDLVRLFRQIPGVVFTSIAYSQEDGLWTYKGTLYEAA